MTLARLGTSPAGSDDWHDAPVIVGGTMSQPTSNVGLTDDVYAGPYGYTRSAWWRYVAPADGYVNYFAISPSGSYLYNEFHTFADTVAGMEASYVGEASNARWGSYVAVTAGQTYYIVVAGSEDPPIDDEYVLYVGRVVPEAGGDYRPGPVGADNFADAPPALTGGSVYPFTANTGYTREPGEPRVDVWNGQTAWWTWTAPRDGWVDLSRGGNYIVAAVWTGDSLDSLTSIASAAQNDNAASCRWMATAGVEYKIQFGHYDGNQDSLANYAPYLQFWPNARRTIIPVASTVNGNVNRGTLVGGATALSTDDLAGYFTGTGQSGPQYDFNSAFCRITFPTAELPPQEERLGMDFVVTAESPAPFDYTTMTHRDRSLSLFGTSYNGSGRNVTLGPLAERRTFRAQMPVDYYDWNYDQIEFASTSYGETTPFTFEVMFPFTSNGEPFTVYYMAIEVISIGEDPEVGVPLPVLVPAFTAVVDASGRAVDFDATASTSGTPIVSYAWDFGDAAYGVLPGQPVEGVTLAHTYLALTQYTITLTVTDGDGNTASVAHQVTLEAGAIDGDHVNDRCAFSGAM